MVSDILTILVMLGLFVIVGFVLGFAFGVTYANKNFSQADDEPATEEPEPQTFFVSVQTTITDGDGNIVAEDEKEFSFEA